MVELLLHIRQVRLEDPELVVDISERAMLDKENSSSERTRLSPCKAGGVGRELDEPSLRVCCFSCSDVESMPNTPELLQKQKVTSEPVED